MVWQQTRLIATVVVAVLWSAAHVAHAQAPEVLPLNQIVEGVVPANEPGEYVIEVEEPGILTVAVRAEADDDLILKVTDMFYQPLPGGESDQDLGGNRGAEQVAVTISRPGRYRVVVETFGFGFQSRRAQFKLVSGFLRFPAVAAEAGQDDPHGTPDTAHELAIAERHTASLDPGSGNVRNWYRIVAPGNGELVVTTRGDEGDLMLHAYAQDSYREEIAHSDQDLQGNTAHEAVVLQVREGEVYYVRTSSVFHQAVPDYTIRATFSGD